MKRALIGFFLVFFLLNCFSPIGFTKPLQLAPVMPPTVTNWPNGPVIGSTYLLTGTKAPYTSVWINNAQAVPPTPASNWEAEVYIEEGPNSFGIYAQDTSNPPRESEVGIFGQITSDISDAHIFDLLHSRAAYYAIENHAPNGLIYDNSGQPGYNSIAATGFGLGALISAHSRYGTSENWNIPQEQIENQIETLVTTLCQIQNNQPGNEQLYGTHGFFYHFINNNGQRFSNDIEVSAIDNAILFAGLYLAREYFTTQHPHPTIPGIIQDIFDYEYLDWSLFYNETQDIFYCEWKPGFGLNPEATLTDYANSDELTLIALISYMQNPGNPNYKKQLFTGTRFQDVYAGHVVHNSYYGSLFTYYFAHCFFNFEEMGPDKPYVTQTTTSSVDWLENSKQAALANRQFCINNQYTYSSYGEDSWGLSATLGPDGEYYGLLGAKPCDNNNGNPIHNGIVPTTSATSCMPILEEPGEDLWDNLGMRVMRHMYEMFGENAFDYSSFDHNGNHANFITGIDALSATMMMENYQTELLWNTFMQVPEVITATNELFTYEGTPLNYSWLEAEYFTSQYGGVLDYKPNASNGLTLGGGWGRFSNHYAIYNVYLVEAQETILNLRYSDDVGNSHVYVYVDGVQRGSFWTVDTGTWENFQWSPDVNLGTVTNGFHEIKFMTLGQSAWGVNLDIFSILDPSLTTNRQTYKKIHINHKRPNNKKSFFVISYI